MKTRICSWITLVSVLLMGSAMAKADVLLEWNAIAMDTAVANGQNPFAQARTAAIVQRAFAVHDKHGQLPLGLAAKAGDNQTTSSSTVQSLPLQKR
jgi:hypothetical protein